MKISSRHILKTAGPKEAKKADGLNFDHVKKTLSDGGSKQVSKEEILAAKSEESNLLISSDKIEQIRSLELVPDARKRVNDVETALIIIGAVLNSNSKEEAKSAVELFDWYLQYKELSPGSFGIDISIIQDADKINLTFKELFDKVKKAKEESDATSNQSAGKEYISNEVIYDFGDGWKVVYVPATGEIESFPGLPGTSHDRILEGNKNGLCLGASQRFYQDNDNGKIFSVRDPENNPRVTIRISGNSLQEAKGKNNNQPDIDGAIHAKRWFESLDKLSYKNSSDFEKFPPTDIEKVINAIESDPASPFKGGWAPHWYGKGIQALDEDIEKKFADLDPAIIEADFGKYPKFFEEAKLVVIHWCKKYINEGDKEAKNTLFGSGFRLPNHEVYKTYRKEEFMKRAAEKLSEEDPYKYFTIKLQEYPEYKSFSDRAIRTYAEQNPIGFLSYFSEKPWAEPYIDSFAKVSISKEPGLFLRYFSKKPWAKSYIDDARKNCAEQKPFDLLFIFSEEPWAIEARPELEGASYLDISAKAYAERKSYFFLKDFSEKPWAIEARPELEGKSYTDIAAKAYAMKEPIDFLNRFSGKPWAAPHVDDARKALAKKNPINFLRGFSLEDWAKEERPELKGKSYVDLAREALNAESLNQTASQVNVKLLKLAKVLRSLRSEGLSKEISQIKDLARNCE